MKSIIDCYTLRSLFNFKYYGSINSKVAQVWEDLTTSLKSIIWLLYSWNKLVYFPIFRDITVESLILLTKSEGGNCNEKIFKLSLWFFCHFLELKQPPPQTNKTQFDFWFFGSLTEKNNKKIFEKWSIFSIFFSILPLFWELYRLLISVVWSYT